MDMSGAEQESKGRLRELVERMEHRVKSHMSRPHRGRAAQIGGWHYYFDEACDRCQIETALAEIAASDSPAAPAAPSEMAITELKAMPSLWRHFAEHTNDVKKAAYIACAERLEGWLMEWFGSGEAALRSAATTAGPVTDARSACIEGETRAEMLATPPCRPASIPESATPSGAGESALLAKIRKVANQCEAGGHTSRARMLRAIADEHEAAVAKAPEPRQHQMDVGSTGQEHSSDCWCTLADEREKERLRMEGIDK